MSEWQIAGYVVSIGALIVGVTVAGVFIAGEFFDWLNRRNDTPNDIADGDHPHVPCWFDFHASDVTERRR